MNLVKRRKWFRQAHNHILMQQLNKKVDSVMQHIYNASKTEFDSKGYRERERNLPKNLVNIIHSSGLIKHLSLENTIHMN